MRQSLLSLNYWFVHQQAFAFDPEGKPHQVPFMPHPQQLFLLPLQLSTGPFISIDCLYESLEDIKQRRIWNSGETSGAIRYHEAL